MPATHDVLTGLALIVVLGVAAQWLAWRLRLPSILLLLAFGFLAGPVGGLLNPGALFGDLLLPIVSISVAVILFEGGLSLRIADLRHIGGVVRNLVTAGAVITWLLAALAAHWCLDDGEAPLSWQVSLLLGAILVVTGPTVIIPLLRHVRPRAHLESILRWEGIVIDPVGAILAVLVFQAVLAGPRFSAGTVAWNFVATILIGGGVGLAGAGVLYVMLRRFLVPDHLQNAVTLMLLVGVFTLANSVQEEAGVFAVTIMGIALANQRSVAVKHIAEFKENLQVILISALFIILAAGLELSHLARLDAGMALFLAALIVVIRPLMVLATTLRSGLGWRDRLFLSMMAPRGIVAAAVASVFALHATRAVPAEEQAPWMAQAELLLPFTFIVIAATVAFYGLGAPLVARWVGLADPNPQGTVIVGGHPYARAMAAALQATGCHVLVVDTNRDNLLAARMEGIPTFHGNVLTEHALEHMDLDGMGRVLAITPNDEVNALATLHFAEVFDRAGRYQLAPASGAKEADLVPSHLRGRYLFGEGVTFDALAQRWAAGARIKATRITGEFTYEAFRAHYGDSAVPLFVLAESGRVTVVTATEKVEPRPGETLISLAGISLAGAPATPAEVGDGAADASA